MSRLSRDQDFSAPDSDDDADPSPLRRLVLAQLEAPGGAAVRLATGPTLPQHPEVARELGLDPAALEPFTADAYLFQSALGEDALRRTPPSDGAVVAVNYHDVPAEHRGAVEERLRRLRDLGPVLDPDVDLGAAPGETRVVVAFYDSYRDAGLFGAELCHRLGLRAWFFPLFESPAGEPRAATLTDAELADVATVHELCFHTASHARAEDVTADDLGREVVDVHARLTELGGRPPRTGAWLGGSRWDAAHPGNLALRELGVRFHVSNWSVEPVPSADWLTG